MIREFFHTHYFLDTSRLGLGLKDCREQDSPEHFSPQSSHLTPYQCLTPQVGTDELAHHGPSGGPKYTRSGSKTNRVWAWSSTLRTSCTSTIPSRSTRSPWARIGINGANGHRVKLPNQRRRTKEAKEKESSNCNRLEKTSSPCRDTMRNPLLPHPPWSRRRMLFAQRLWTSWRRTTYRSRRSTSTSSNRTSRTRSTKTKRPWIQKKDACSHRAPQEGFGVQRRAVEPVSSCSQGTSSHKCYAGGSATNPSRTNDATPTSWRTTTVTADALYGGGAYCADECAAYSTYLAHSLTYGCSSKGASDPTSSSGTLFKDEQGPANARRAVYQTPNYAHGESAQSLELEELDGQEVMTVEADGYGMSTSSWRCDRHHVFTERVDREKMKFAFRYSFGRSTPRFYREGWPRANELCVSLQFRAIDTTFLPRGLTESKWTLRFATVLGDRHHVFTERVDREKMKFAFRYNFGRSTPRF